MQKILPVYAIAAIIAFAITANCSQSHSAPPEGERPTPEMRGGARTLSEMSGEDARRAMIDGVAKAADAPNRTRAALTETLIEIAKDEHWSNEVRHTAIEALGKLRSPEATAFLISHIALRIHFESFGADDEYYHSYPCAYALSFSGNWDVARAIIASADGTQTPDECEKLAMVLRDVFVVKELAVAAIDAQCRLATTTDASKRTLLAVKKIIEGLQ